MSNPDMFESEVKWLGLAIRSESDEPHEWVPVAWSIRNRVLSPRYPNTYQGVILQRKQYSYFNKFYGMKAEDIYNEAIKGYAGDNSGWGENDLKAAQQCARDIILSPRYKAPFGADVMHFYSPISMDTVSSKPSWMQLSTRIVHVSGIDPKRFVFAAGVK